MYINMYLYMCIYVYVYVCLYIFSFYTCVYILMYTWKQILIEWVRFVTYIYTYIWATHVTVVLVSFFVFIFVFSVFRFPEAPFGAICQKAWNSCQSGEDGAKVWTHPSSSQRSITLHWPGVFTHKHVIHYSPTFSQYAVYIASFLKLLKKNIL